MNSKALTALAALSSVSFTLGITPFASAQIQPDPTPLEWITSKDGFQQQTTERSTARGNRSLGNEKTETQNIEKNYVLNTTNSQQLIDIKTEAARIFGKPSKTEKDALIWYVPNPDFSLERSAMTSVTIRENPSGQAQVIVKQMSRPKRSRPQLSSSGR